MLQELRLKDIKPNPFRHMENYLLDPAQVADLRRSIKQNGWWETVLVRQTDAGPELAFGHHRLQALIEEYGANAKLAFNVHDLDDAAMLRCMADENASQKQSWAVSVLDSVAAVVQAYADGIIPLTTVKKTQREGVAASYVRFAPSFIAGSIFSDREDRAYTTTSVAKFLGWMKKDGKTASDQVKIALDALEFIELGVRSRGDFEGKLTREGAEAIIHAAREDAEALKRAQQESEKAAERAERASEQRAKAEAKAQADREKAEAAKQAKRAREAEERRAKEAEEVERLNAEVEANREAAKARAKARAKAETRKTNTREKARAKRGGRAPTGQGGRAPDTHVDVPPEWEDAFLLELERDEHQPNTPEGDAARKAQALLVKAISVEGTPEADALYHKAGTIIKRKKLYVRVSVVQDSIT